MSLGVSLPKPSINARPMGAHCLFMLTDDALFDACGTRIAFTSRDGGVSKPPYASLNLGSHVGDDASAVLENRRRVLEAIGVASAPLVVPNQVHETNVIVVDGPAGACDVCADAQRANEAAAQGADAVVVRERGVAALLNFADCTPVIIVSPTGNFAIAHAGWRGAVAHVASKAVRSLVEADLRELAASDAVLQGSGAFSQLAAACNVYIGPHIQVECFETGEDVAQRFREAYPQDVSAIVPDSRHVDLSQAVIADLLQVGVSRERILDTGICTKCNHDKYFSYRAESGVCGRHGAVAVRSKD